MEEKKYFGRRLGSCVFRIRIVLLVFMLGTAVTTYGQRGPVVFVTNYLERGSFSTKPQPEQIKDTIHVFAAPGEYEPATFSIRSATELKNIHVEMADDLKTDAGLTIPKSAVEVRLVDPFEQWTKKKLEYFLLKREAVDVAVNTTRRFWITIHVPDHAKPGIYRSKIVIGRPIVKLGPDLGRLEILTSLTYEVQVLPIKLATAQETGMAYFMYNNTAYFARLPDGVEKFVTEAYQRRVFEDMREHGMTTATLYLYPVVDKKFTLTGHTKNYLGFAPTMKILKKAKLVTAHLPVIWLGAENYGTDVWQAVLDEGRKRNWPEIVFYAVDEPGEEKRNKRVRAFMKTFNAFRSKYPEYGVRVTTALGSSAGIHKVGNYYDLWTTALGSSAGIHKVGNYYDLWIGHVLLAMGDIAGEWPKEMGWDKDMLSEAKRLKKELWVYDCTLAPVDAETNRYYFGQLADRFDVEMPIAQTVYDVLFAGRTPGEAIACLIRRPLRAEA